MCVFKFLSVFTQSTEGSDVTIPLDPDDQTKMSPTSEDLAITDGDAVRN